MDFPICNASYSNAFDVSDVKFLVDVEQFTTAYINVSNDILCNWCKTTGSLPQPLQRCGGCQLVADCQREDRPWHKYFCKEFPIVEGKNVLFTNRPIKVHINHLRQQANSLPLAEFNPMFSNRIVCNFCKETRQDRLTVCICSCVSYCNKTCSMSDTLHKGQCSMYRDLLCFSSSMALMFALESLPGHRLGRNHRALEKHTTLTVHVVTSNPSFNSEPWEDFMHQLPKLK